MKICRSRSINYMSNLDIFNWFSSINSFSFNWSRFRWSSFWFILWLFRSFWLIFISSKTLGISYYSRLCCNFILISPIYLGRWLTILPSCCSCSNFSCLWGWTSISTWTWLISVSCWGSIRISCICLGCRWATSCCSCSCCCFCCNFFWIIWWFCCRLLWCYNFSYYFSCWIWVFSNIGGGCWWWRISVLPPWTSMIKGFPACLL